ncbi:MULTISPECIES: LysR family transcriptional regulator [unclassified Pseudomonas]|uniref:LysR family transcriptional regulator n=1 Tax=unclassified Pseudomonas TaxID=196821 RepID=UPI000D36209F|nr:MULTISPECIES: LysR family transcriptional regulator [unclassified Pseudomonas]RAU43842.1 LysR family transcriptional regulator [Pseudomonas sp. RIT 409]RAU56264.1 LysR family transcriptional regulator [Pseudomonas sp. RIT 412]
MKLSQLGFFCAVVEHGTIAAAAASLHCVPSNITARLRELESQLGVVLFNRENNRLLVTPEGRLVYRKAKQLIDLAAETRSLFSNDSIQGVLRVGALDVALANHLPERLVRYRLEAPGVEVHIRPEHSLFLERLLMDGELDLILTDGPIQHPLLDSRLAFRERLLRVVPKSLSPPTPQDLSRLELYVFGRTCHYRQQVDDWLESSGIQPRAILEIESYPTIFACIAQGIGFACVPESYVDRFASQAHTFQADQAPSLDSSDIYFVWRKNQQSPLIRNFIEVIDRQGD